MSGLVARIKFVLWLACRVRDPDEMDFWTELYLGLLAWEARERIAAELREL